ncbi:hypothetical protein D9M72_622980 [compost metagenome]
MFWFRLHAMDDLIADFLNGKPLALVDLLIDRGQFDHAQVTQRFGDFSGDAESSFPIPFD